jgi:hypothetical protein
MAKETAMRNTAWSMTMSMTIFLVLAAGATGAGAASFLPRALAPEHGVDVLRRSDAERLVGRTLLADPAASAVWGEVHLYDRVPYVDAHYVQVTSDARWQRLLYGAPGEAPRAFGSAGSGPANFREPRGLSFAPDGRLFVADRGLGRVTVLRLVRNGDAYDLAYVTHVDGLDQPMDVAVHDGGTPAEPDDDRLLVAEAGSHQVAIYVLDADRAVRVAEFGQRGSADGEFLFPRALVVGREAGRSADVVYVADSGNHRLVRLRLSGQQLSWDAAATLPMEATSVDADHYGNLFVTLRRQNSVLKMSPGLETVATLDDARGALVAPRDVAIPFAWVHDHRRLGTQPRWQGQGSALVLEERTAQSGVRLVDLGVEIARLSRPEAATLEFTLTDAAHARLLVTDAAGEIVAHDLGERPAGTQRVQDPALETAVAVTLEAASLYDPARADSRTLPLSPVPGGLVLHQNVPNPFNPVTTIAFELPQAAQARLDVFDVRGRRVRRLVDARLDAGPHTFTWDGKDTQGTAMPSGVYFYRLHGDAQTLVRKMVMAR